jgi:hypothetical protein
LRDRVRIASLLPQIAIRSTHDTSGWRHTGSQQLEPSDGTGQGCTIAPRSPSIQHSLISTKAPHTPDRQADRKPSPAPEVHPQREGPTRHDQPSRRRTTAR